MRVLAIHNAYASSGPSGENAVVAAEVNALRSAGLDVQVFLRSSDELLQGSTVVRLRNASAPLTGSASAEQLTAHLDAFQPDIVHVHNLYPLISPRVIDFCMERHIPVVASVHNYRRACLNGALTRDSAGCVECVGHSPARGVLHRCYRGSAAQSALMAAAMVVHRKRWAKVSRFLAVSEHVARWLQADGVPGDRIVVKPNFVEDPGRGAQPGHGLVFAGRLVPEKGLELLLDAWGRVNNRRQVPLFVAGSGPLERLVGSPEAKARHVEFLGQLDSEALKSLRSRAAAAVVPSVWPEPFGLVAVESLAAGRPVVATSVGGLPEIIDPSVGWIVEPSPPALAAGIAAVMSSESLSGLGEAARSRYEARFHPDVVTRELINCYLQVLR